ncbi:MAG: hypothetical protein Q8R79_06120, partial [Legionellaceae bacterium]|nr:hypothetical protein [Legionellaceae bacterium]
NLHGARTRRESVRMTLCVFTKALYSKSLVTTNIIRLEFLQETLAPFGYFCAHFSIIYLISLANTKFFTRLNYYAEMILVSLPVY